MNNIYICPDHESCGSSVCFHIIVHEKRSGCDGTCFKNTSKGGVKCVEISNTAFKPLISKTVPIVKVIISKNTPKATRRYIRNK